MKTRKIIPILVLVLAGISIFNYLTDHNEPSTQISKPKISSGQPNNFPTRELVSEQMVKGITKKNSEEKTKPERIAALRSKYEKSTSFRAFVYEALKHPEDGGYYYVFNALGTCKTVKNIDVEKLKKEIQKDALAKLNQKCDISAEEEIDIRARMMYDRTEQAESISRDPMIEIGINLGKTKNTNQYQENIREVLKTNDLNMIRSLLNPPPDYEQAEDTKSIVYFDGKSYETKTEIEFLNYALDIAACTTQGNCEAGTTSALKLCVENGWCDENIRESISNGLAAQYGRNINLNTLSSRLVVAIKNKNSDLFINKTGQKSSN